MPPLRLDRADNICTGIPRRRVLQVNKNLRSTQCLCGYGFKPSDIKPPLRGQKDVFGTDDPNFYGGVVKKFSKAVCPECGQPYLLYLKQGNGQWTIKDIAPIDEPKVEPEQLIYGSAGYSDYRKLYKDEQAEKPILNPSEIKRAMIDSIIADLPNMKRLELFALAKEKEIKINTKGKNEEIIEQITEGLKG
jgi:hypothetical protein